MSYTVEQMRAWEPALHKWLEYGKIDHSKPDQYAQYDDARKRVRAARRNDGPGVYCAWNEDVLAYIGYSKTVLKRISAYYFSDFPGKGLHFTWLRCVSPEEAAALEADLIELYKPIQNLRREPKGGQVRDFTKRGPRSRYRIIQYYGGR